MPKLLVLITVICDTPSAHFRLPGTSGTGSGLGLAIAKEVTLAPEGHIEISAAPGDQGTLLRVSFPDSRVYQLSLARRGRHPIIFALVSRT